MKPGPKGLLLKTLYLTQMLPWPALPAAPVSAMLPDLAWSSDGSLWGVLRMVPRLPAEPPHCGPPALAPALPASVTHQWSSHPTAPLLSANSCHLSNPQNQLGSGKTPPSLGIPHSQISICLLKMESKQVQTWRSGSLGWEGKGWRGSILKTNKPQPPTAPELFCSSTSCCSGADGRCRFLW